MRTQNPYVLPDYAGNACVSGPFRDLQITDFPAGGRKINLIARYKYNTKCLKERISRVLWNHRAAL
jgi:hypothetical protein